MKIKNIITGFLVVFILVSCTPVAKVVSSETTTPIPTFMTTPTTAITPTSEKAIATITATPVNSQGEQVSTPIEIIDSDQMIEMAENARNKGEYPQKLTKDQTVAFFDALEKLTKAESSPIFTIDEEDPNNMRVYVTDPTVMDKYVKSGEVIAVDNVFWYKVSKNFFTKHPETAELLKPETWIPVYKTLDQASKETGEKEYYDRETGAWNKINGAERIGDGWQTLLTSESDLAQAEATGAFSKPTGSTAEELFSNFGDGSYGFLPIVLLDPEDSTSFAKSDKTTAGIFTSAPAMILQTDSKTGFYGGRKAEIGGLIWTITQGGSTREDVLSKPESFATNPEKKLLITGDIYYVQIPIEYGDKNSTLDKYDNGLVPAKLLSKSISDIDESVKSPGLLVFPGGGRILVKLPN